MDRKGRGLGLFAVMLRIFAATKFNGRDFNKLVVFDEAHKYIIESDLIGQVVETIRTHLDSVAAPHDVCAVAEASQERTRSFGRRRGRPPCPRSGLVTLSFGLNGTPTSGSRSDLSA